MGSGDPGPGLLLRRLWKAPWALGVRAELHNGLLSLDSAPYWFDLLPTRRPWATLVTVCELPPIKLSITCDFLPRLQEPLCTQGRCPDAGAGSAAQEGLASGNVAVGTAGGQSSVQAVRHGV